MPDEFAHLHGHRLAAFAREEASNNGWSQMWVAEGSFSLEALALIAGGGAPNPKPSPALLAAIEAIRSGRLRLLADGDDTLGFAEIFVPLGLLRGRWHFDARTEGLRARAAGSFAGPTFYRPRFALAEQPVAAEQAPAEGDTKPKKPAYGETQPALRKAWAAYQKELSDYSTDDGKAEFLVQKVGCHKNSAITFLKNLQK